MVGPASSRTVRSPSARWPSDLPRLRVSTVVGKTRKTVTRVPIQATQISAASAWEATTNRSSTTSISSARVTAMSIIPETIRTPRPAGGRSSATASPVTRSSSVRVANSGGRAVASDMARGYGGRCVQWARGPGRLRARPHPRVATSGGAHQAPAALRRRERRVRRALPAGRHASLGRAHVRARRVARRLPVVDAREGPDPLVGHPHHLVARRRPLLHRAVPGGAVPAALLVAGHARRQRAGRRA